MKSLMTTILVFALLATSCAQENDARAGKGRSPKPPVITLHMAALQGNIDAVRQHIETGSDIDKKDAYGSTPLIISITFGKTEVAQALIEAGANIEIRNNDGSTPLHIAAFFCRTEMVKALLDKGADENAKNNAGHTALQSVSGPFEDVVDIYDRIENALKPLGLRLDYDRIRQTRPRIAEMLSAMPFQGQGAVQK